MPGIHRSIATLCSNVITPSDFALPSNVSLTHLGLSRNRIPLKAVQEIEKATSDRMQVNIAQMDEVVE